MAVNEKGKKRHPVRKLLILLVLAALIAVGVYFGLGLGFGRGGGSGDGDGKGPDATASLPADAPAPESTPPAEEDAESQGGAQEAITVTVEVTQGKYLIDGEEVSLADIEALLQKADPDASTFIVDDNYGSAKAYDELTALFEQYGVSAVTQ